MNLVVLPVESAQYFHVLADVLFGLALIVEFELLVSGAENIVAFTLDDIPHEGLCRVRGVGGS